MKKKEKRLIGRADRADFPQLELNNLDVKIDTGAYTGAIHSTNIQEVEVDGKKKIRFTLLDKTHPEYNFREFEYSNYRQKRVKNSFGVSEKRFVIETLIVLFNEAFLTEFTLSERGEMKYPVLIGRKLLNKYFLVDTARTNLSFKAKIKKEHQENENSNPVPQP